ncbi:MAG: hypothetical protein ABIZ80_23720 [Bryobacteraceae bacterium]
MMTHAALVGLLCSFLLAAQPANKCAEAQALIAKSFATHARIRAGHTPCILKGDFDRDGVEDFAALVVLLSDHAALPADVKLANPWSSQASRLPGKKDLAIAVVFGKSGAKYLIGDKETLSTPIWRNAAAKDLILLVRKSNPPKIGVATEAGIDVLLQWNGKQFRLEIPKEEP